MVHGRNGVLLNFPRFRRVLRSPLERKTIPHGTRRDDPPAEMPVKCPPFTVFFTAVFHGSLHGFLNCSPHGWNGVKTNVKKSVKTIVKNIV